MRRLTLIAFALALGACADGAPGSIDITPVGGKADGETRIHITLAPGENQVLQAQCDETLSCDLLVAVNAFIPGVSGTPAADPQQRKTTTVSGEVVWIVGYVEYRVSTRDRSQILGKGSNDLYGQDSAYDNSFPLKSSDSKGLLDLMVHNTFSDPINFIVDASWQ